MLIKEDQREVSWSQTYMSRETYLEPNIKCEIEFN
jgi:hypothetical protein